MAGIVKSALPSHLKPAAASGGGDDNGFERRHHGKTRSHMVSKGFFSALFSLRCPLYLEHSLYTARYPGSCVFAFATIHLLLLIGSIVLVLRRRNATQHIAFTAIVSWELPAAVP
ncbi:hypothetical protein H634G_05890 [Metarhizium anisopliae BRIP 53293]|uniref:Uncharacterized protein n=2 Tax=Metarhizium TaxID=5529 RepID=A0A0D9P2P7_METAN